MPPRATSRRSPADPSGLRRDRPRRRRGGADVRRASPGSAGGGCCWSTMPTQPGKKILISGGGRCNFTNLHTAPDRYLSANPHFAKSALGRYTARDFLALVERHGIAWHEKTLGQLFCDGSARQIVAHAAGRMRRGARSSSRSARPIRDVAHADGRFRVDARRAHRRRAGAGDRHRRAVDPEAGRDRLRLRSRPPLRPEGGRAAPRAGAADARRRRGAVPRALRRRDRGRRARRQGGVPRGRAVHPPRPVRPGDPAGLVLLAARRADRRSTSCPTRAPGWLRDGQARRARARPSAHAARERAARPARRGAGRTARRWRGELANLPTASCDEAERGSPTGASPRTAPKASPRPKSPSAASPPPACRRRRWRRGTVPGLYAIGEAVDVTGWLGGYNFQWAWASGWAAGQAL